MSDWVDLGDGTLLNMRSITRVDFVKPDIDDEIPARVIVNTATTLYVWSVGTFGYAALRAWAEGGIPYYLTKDGSPGCDGWYWVGAQGLKAGERFISLDVFEYRAEKDKWFCGRYEMLTPVWWAELGEPPMGAPLGEDDV